FSPYPHSTHTFIKSINLTLTLSIHKHFLIHTPLISLHKPHTSPLTHNLPLLHYIPHNTLTCYNPIIPDPSAQCPPSHLT
ncbi:7-cyano-7-deazaguanine synthase, partial [Staphylococcus epidermidis]|uniref:7-cyano-7-deazaguanine synthase n=1 Tax=Staphylococcus epidermidis TaxID=1282 RepID=UPI001642CAE6